MLTASKHLELILPSHCCMPMMLKTRTSHKMRIPTSIMSGSDSIKVVTYGPNSERNQTPSGGGLVIGPAEMESLLSDFLADLACSIEKKSGFCEG